MLSQLPFIIKLNGLIHFNNDALRLKFSFPLNRRRHFKCCRLAWLMEKKWTEAKADGIWQYSLQSCFQFDNNSDIFRLVALEKIYQLTVVNNIWKA